jgi:hypothetical protein
VVDGSVSFGDVSAGANVPSSDTFVIEQNRLYPFDPSALVWDVRYGPYLPQIHALIKRFAPILYFNRNEKYFMDDPEYVLDNGVSMAYGLECTLPYYSLGKIDLKIFKTELRYFSCEKTFGWKYREMESFPTSAATITDDTSTVFHNWTELIRRLPVPYWIEGKYWLHIPDKLIPGDFKCENNRAKALVRVLPIKNYPMYIEIQFWLFFPFNGPGRVEVCAAGGCDDIWLNEVGRHYGDWERVIILVNYITEELHAVDISMHGESALFDCALGRKYGYRDKCPCVRATLGLMEKRPLHLDPSDLTHPRILVAAWSHALYQYAADHIYYHKPKEPKRVFDWGIAHGTLFDRTNYDLPFYTWSSGGPDDQPRYRIVSSEVPNAPVTEPGWFSWGAKKLEYFKRCVKCPPAEQKFCAWMSLVHKPECGNPVISGGRWGQREPRLCDEVWGVHTHCMGGDGPSGPVKQDAWDGVEEFCDSTFMEPCAKGPPAPPAPPASPKDIRILR